MSVSSGRVVSGVLSLAGGLASAMLGLFIGLWARAHSPHMGLGEMLSRVAEDPEAYYLKEELYTIICLCAGGLGFVGLTLLVLGVVLCATSGTRPRMAPPPAPRAPSEASIMWAHVVEPDPRNVTSYDRPLARTRPPAS